jgi:hypothetical protein
MDFDVDFALAFNEGNSSTNFYIDACRYGSSTPVLATDYIGNVANQLGGSAEFNIGSVFGGSGNIKIAYRNNFAADSLSGIEMKIPISAFAGVDNTQQIQLFAIILNSSGFFSNECIPGDPGATNPGNNPNFSSMSGGPYHTGQYPLPIELTEFYARKNENSVLLNWATSTEVNSYKFEVEKRIKKDWEKIGEVLASGNSNSPKFYSFVDKNLSRGLILYRLKMIDNDGSYKYSNTTEVYIENPKTFSLFQNYPNPFNPSTVIRYQIPVDGRVSLKVYDVLGKEIATLVDEYKEAGRYEVEFNVGQTISLSFLSSGMYFYKLQVEDYVEVKKMILAK